MSDVNVCEIGIGCVQVDAKEVARRRALEAKAEAKAAQLRRETRGMKSISSLFGKYQCTDNA